MVLLLILHNYVTVFFHTNLEWLWKLSSILEFYLYKLHLDLVWNQTQLILVTSCIILIYQLVRSKLIRRTFVDFIKHFISPSLRSCNSKQKRHHCLHPFPRNDELFLIVYVTFIEVACRTKSWMSLYFQCSLERKETAIK